MDRMFQGGMDFFNFPHGAMGGRSTFKQEYRCYSVIMMPGNEREDVDKGGKIIMPPSALDQLSRLHIQYPMMFKLSSDKTKRTTHCGVLEFVADEGRIYLPGWMMRNLALEEGALVKLESVTLPTATFAKFQPQSPDFLDISNPKAVLENALRNFATLTKGDLVGIKYNNKLYELSVLELKPAEAVSIIECDMNVDFAAPVGYKEPERQMPRRQQQEEEEDQMQIDPHDLVDNSKFRAFQGTGVRLDGKVKATEESVVDKLAEYTRGVPNYDFNPKKLTFIRGSKIVNGATTEEKQEFSAFSGQGQVLKKKKNRY